MHRRGNRPGGRLSEDHCLPFVGIDLGTTNSVLATFDGEQVSVIPNGLGENLTPSVVRLDARGRRPSAAKPGVSWRPIRPTPGPSSSV